jgi:beta-lactamase class A
MDMRVDRYERELQPEISGMESFRIAWKGWPAFAMARDSVPEATRRAAAARYLADPRDTTTASGALTFLRLLQVRELLSPRSTALLLKIMIESRTGEGRLKAGLPPGATLAHKTGTSATDLGMTMVVNDIGIVTLRDGRCYAVVVFMTGSTQDEAAQDQVFSDIMRVIVRAAGKRHAPH